MDAEGEASRILRTYWAAGDPVDPVKIARRLGLNVFRSRMEAGVSGALSKSRNEPGVIYLNADHHTHRQRFTCAHELGHYVKRTAEDTTSFEYIDRRDDLSSTGTHPDEVFANQFAAALLMPADRVRRLRAQHSPRALAKHFGVSPTAMEYRLANLGL